eukprot:scaffold32053_cov59-Phaeocystis_antarctica.AAC.4
MGAANTAGAAGTTPLHAAPDLVDPLAVLDGGPGGSEGGRLRNEAGESHGALIVEADFCSASTSGSERPEVRDSLEVEPVVVRTPALSAAADNAAVVTVVERAATALHIVKEALLLGLQLLVALLQAPLVLVKAPFVLVQPLLQPFLQLLLQLRSAFLQPPCVLCQAILLRVAAAQV